MFCRMTIARAATALTVAMLIVGCGTTSRPIGDYEPFSDLSGLVLDESQSPTLIYRRPNAPGLDAYTAFIVDEVKIDTRDPDAKKLAPQDAERIQSYFRDRLTNELHEGGYTIADTPGEQTMRISFVLSGLKVPTAAANVTLVLAPVAMSVGGVTVEGTFREAMSNRTDAVAIDRSVGSRVLNPTPWSTWDDVESALAKWAKGIRESVDKAHGK